MSVFGDRLRQLTPATGDRRWIYVPYDQLTDAIGPLAEQPAAQTGIVLVETPAKAARRPYHRQKLALNLANQRHFALEQAQRGVAVRYLVHEQGYAAALSDFPHPLVMMEAAERELRVELAPLIARGALRVVPHAGWLTTSAHFGSKGPPWRMDAFYRTARKATGLLMDGDQPRGGRWSFDQDNRKPWKGDPPAPTPPVFTPDAITREIGELVSTRFSHHPGTLDLSALPATAADAETLWSWAKRACLPQFGPFEDALSRHSSGLFHSRCAALINLHRLLPARLVREAAALPLPLASQEGFIRQILGWREFVHLVHVATDGFRTVPSNLLDVHEPLPAAYWPGAPSGLACLDAVVANVWREGWSHHISRLMVLANLATLLDVDPRQTTDWFWIAYTDAFDWVVEPNVLGMGTFAAGETMVTKPYIGGGAYLGRMGDHCQTCRFHPQRDGPITTLYWDWLRRHGRHVQRNPRMTTICAAQAKRGADRHAADQRRADAIRRQLAAAQTLTPESLA